MKLRFLLFVLLSVFALSGCGGDPAHDDGEDRIWDIYPIGMTINVTDAKGNDLLNPQTVGCLDYRKIKATYGGVDFECQNGIVDKNSRASKAYMPQFYGLRYYKSNNVYNLYFGELRGDKNYTDATVVISWGDGTSDKIGFNRTFSWKANGDPEVTHSWSLNDVVVESGRFVIVK